MVTDIRDWLEELGLGKFTDLFVDNDIDIAALPHITDEDLRELGVTVGARRKILAARVSPQEPQALDYGPANQDPTPPITATESAERRQLTVMFCDLVGSTELANRLDPEDLRGVMRRYQDGVSGAIVRYGGHVAKFLGDGVLAYFGWPQAYEDQAERAIRAGLDAVQAVSSIVTDGYTLAARIGIATGEVVVGELSGETDAIVGETPNLAARLQMEALPGEIVTSVITHRLIGDVFDMTALGGRRLRGFSDLVPVWRVDDERVVEGRFAAQHAGPLTHFVGRDHEIGLLLERWSLAKAGEGQVALLSGPPGIGKSRIVSALTEHLADEDLLRLHYQCSPYHQSIPFYPLMRQLELAAGFAADDENGDKLLKLETLLDLPGLAASTIVPLFATLLSVPTDERYGQLELSPPQFREKLMAAIIDYLLAEADRKPVLMVLEDAHWMDPSTEALIGDVFTAIRDAAVFMLVAHRPDYAPPWSNQPHFISLLLGHFSRAQSARVVQHLAGDLFDDDVVDRLIERAGGVPLYVEELTKSLLENEAGAGAIEVPATLQASLLSRLDRLGPAKHVAQVGAVIGREFTRVLLSVVADVNVTQLDTAIRSLLKSELVLAIGSPETERYVFRHALIRDAAYDSLLRARRQQLHAKVAETLTSLSASSAETEPELLAFHFREAGLPEQAVEFYHRAGIRAVERSANEEAVDHLTRALDLIRDMPRSTEVADRELEILTLLSPAQMVTKGRQRELLADTLERAKRVARELNKTGRIVPATLGLWLISVNRGDFARANELTQDLFEFSHAEDDSGLLLQAHHAAWTICLFEGEFDATLQHAQSGLRLYDENEHKNHRFVYLGHDPVVCAKALASMATWLKGQSGDALAMSRDAISVAERCDHVPTLVHALLHAGNLHVLREDHHEAQSTATRILEIASKLNMRPAILGAEALYGWSMARSGEVAEGLDRLRKAVSLWKNGGSKLYLPQRLGMLADGLRLAGQVEEALEVNRSALKIVSETGESWHKAVLLYQYADLMRERTGAQTEIEDALNKCLEQAKKQKAAAIELRASIRLARHLRAKRCETEARAVLEAVLSDSADGFEPSELVDAQSILDTLP
jgi:class 3 adenylate cyclase/predicted ATPase